MEVDAEMTKTQWVNRTRIKYGGFFLIVVLSAVGSLFLAKVISPYLEGWEQYGYLGVFIGALISNATVILPGPFIAFTFPLAISLASQTDPFSVSIVYALGSTLGEGVGYILGQPAKRMFNTSESLLYQKAESWLNKHGKWAIIVISFQPIFPFDFIGIVAGALKYPWWFGNSWHGNL